MGSGSSTERVIASRITEGQLRGRAPGLSRVLSEPRTGGPCPRGRAPCVQRAGAPSVDSPRAGTPGVPPWGSLLWPEELLAAGKRPPSADRRLTDV